MSLRRNILLRLWKEIVVSLGLHMAFAVVVGTFLPVGSTMIGFFVPLDRIASWRRPSSDFPRRLCNPFSALCAFFVCV